MDRGAAHPRSRRYGRFHAGGEIKGDSPTGRAAALYLHSQRTFAIALQFFG
jgi:hypothetical protein